MENTLENRLKFYAQHLGQNVIIDSDCFRSENGNDIIHTQLVSVSLKGIECDGWLPVTEHTALELRDISSITDDELGAIARFYNRTATNVYIHDDQLTFDYYHGDQTHSVAVELNSGYCLDFLRSNDFAMEWMGLTVGQLREYGWIKLKSE